MSYTSPKGAKIYIFDTFCKNQTPEEKRRIDAEFIRIYNDTLVRIELEKQECEG